VTGTGKTDQLGAGDDGLDLRPLTARSVVLSLLLGSHPPSLPVRALVACGTLFDIGEGALRVALSRMATAGDVTANGGTYTLSERLQRRQARQDRDRKAATGPWDGRWTVLLVPPQNIAGRDDPDLRSAHLAPLGDRVWMRPDNLDAARTVGSAPGGDGRTTPGWVRMDARPEGDPTVKVGQLWDLPAWAGQADRLIAAFDRADRPAGRFVVAAAILRHLRADPLLPAELLPARWPGDLLRDTYDRFVVELGGLLALYPGSGVPEASARHSSR
jgi:phenylacetic acid degradation operon negative regulatory protein